jgi:hypothetical protein
MPVKDSAEKRELILKSVANILGPKVNEKLHFMHGKKSLIELYKLWTLAVHF